MQYPRLVKRAESAAELGTAEAGEYLRKGLPASDAVPGNASCVTANLKDLTHMKLSMQYLF
ncbi:hypothetical protein AVEN_88744-1, partial [Araneus ventricosus]